MPVTPPSEAPSELLRLRLSAEAASVPGARRFVTDGLTAWGRPALVDDAALCVTEMASNAALHSGSSFMRVVIRGLPDTVHLAVEDDGAMIPLEAVTPRTGGPPKRSDDGDLLLEDQPTTGRGLAIVSVLARTWGVDESSSGRRIWAELSEDQQEYPVRPPRVVRDTESGRSEPNQLPAGWKLMRMPRCPVALAIRIDQHLDDLVRELQLIDADDKNAPTQRVARLIEDLVTRPAYARHTGRRVGQEAAAAGLEYVDVEMPAPRALSPDIRRLLEIVEEADRLCAEQQLLTLASTPEMVSLREWFTESMVGQLEEDAEPVAYADWLARRDRA